MTKAQYTKGKDGVTILRKEGVNCACIKHPRMALAGQMEGTISMNFHACTNACPAFQVEDLGGDKKKITILCTPTPIEYKAEHEEIKEEGPEGKILSISKDEKPN